MNEKILVSKHWFTLVKSHLKHELDLVNEAIKKLTKEERKTYKKLQCLLNKENYDDYRKLAAKYEFVSNIVSLQITLQFFMDYENGEIFLNHYDNNNDLLN